MSSQCRASLDTPRGGAEQASVVQAPLPSFHHMSILPWPTARETASWTRVSILQTPPLLSLALSFLISEVNNDPTIGGGRAHTGLGDKVQALAVTAVPARGQCTGLSEPLRTCCTCHGLAGHSGSAPGTNRSGAEEDSDHGLILTGVRQPLELQLEVDEPHHGIFMFLRLLRKLQITS